ncbi:MAG: DUF1828 domain-containing protein [Methanimicrococcus sp.]|nr:DUF1828 domain-containing protein [Methanimicrococcus sp.]
MINIKDEIEALTNHHINWLKDKTFLKEIENDYVEITTPYLDRHNDWLQYYIKKEKDDYFLTDGGHIITDLKDSGCSFESKRRQNILNTVLAGFNVKLSNDQLYVRVNEKNYPQMMNNLIQATLAIDNMFYLSQSHVESMFYEDVVDWLDLKKIRYSKNIKLASQSGFDHTFHFLIPKSEKAPERFLQIVSDPKKDSVLDVIWKWVDSKDYRDPDVILYTILNDIEKRPPKTSLDALESYQIKPISWLHRELVAEELLI